MCGIVGYIGTADSGIVRLAVANACSAQAHRGPDDSGILVRRIGDLCVGLGHRRLSILDLSQAGHQPMRNPDTGDVVVLNGEIYNFRDLRLELIGKGYEFQTESDTELLLKAYECWDVACLERFRGMFAFGLWDARQRSILLARDHAGIKPLYYSDSTASGLVFASETKALIETGFISSTISDNGLASYLRYGAVQEPLTIFQDIHSLPAGHFYRADFRGILSKPIGKIHHYWQFPAVDRAALNKSNEDLSEELRALLVQSVERHLVSDLPVGVFLSGGLDSAVITSLAARRRRDRIQTFTVSFPDDKEWDESQAAGDLARLCGTQHTAVEIDRSSVVSGVTQYLDAMDQPTIDGLNTFLVSRAARQRGLVVALSGMGSDEMFGGYASFVEIPKALRYMRSAQIIPRGLRNSAGNLLTIGSDRALRSKVSSMLEAGTDLEEVCSVRRQLFSSAEIGNFGLPPVRGLNRFNDQNVKGDEVNSISRLEIRGYLANMLLRDSDVFSMASSLELRVPFLDRDLMEWCHRLPGQVMLPSQMPLKYRLREAVRGWLPEVPLDGTRPKRGFVVPLLKWSDSYLNEVVQNGTSLALSKANIDSHLLLRDFRRRPIMRTWSRLWSVVILGHYLDGVGRKKVIHPVGTLR